MKTFKYERDIPTPMAKGSGKGKKGDKSKKDLKPKKDDRTRKAPKSSPIRTVHHESSMSEVSAKRAFLTSFVLFSAILAPVFGLGAYFARDMGSLQGLMDTAEAFFVMGMLGGVAVAFVGSLIFTRKAIATSS
jgi:hypothetical protein